MVYNLFVEIGRVAFINYGPDAGKLVVIVDVVDQKRALIEGPTSGVTRQAINLRRLSLTKLKVVIPPSARSGTLTKAYAKAEIDKKWAETSYAKKLAMRTKRANLSDFDRFKVMVLRKQRRFAVGKTYTAEKKAALKAAK